jgi:hypothetical protein
MDSQRLELDLHRLELRFASSRLVEPRAVAQIAHSIERCGQIVPCVVVAVPGGPGAAGGERLYSSTDIGASPRCVTSVATSPASSDGRAT